MFALIYLGILTLLTVGSFILLVTMVIVDLVRLFLRFTEPQLEGD